MNVVYIYRKNFSRELEWSIASLVNVKHSGVFIVGDNPDYSVEATIINPRKPFWAGLSPFNDVLAKHMAAAAHSDISDDFIMMNDDMFIMKKWDGVIYDRGDLKDRITNVGRNSYTVMLENTYNWLKKNGYSTKDYTAHTPFVYNKEKLTALINRISSAVSNGHSLSIRTLYGNVYEVESTTIEEDTKNPQHYSKMAILSTTEESFLGEVGRHIRSKLSRKGGLTVYDHNEAEWRSRYMRTGRENGASTYTKEILAHQVPLWCKYAKDAALSTTNLFSKIKAIDASCYIQYLHTYPTDDPQRQVRQVYEHVQNVIFVTSYKALYEEIVDNIGYKAIYIPMTIDGSSLPSHHPYKDRSIIYYGNVTPPKRKNFALLKDFFEQKGWTFDYISNSRLNGEGDKLTQEQCWEIISSYKYGAGVGRCYMEMAAMGLKCIVAGNNIGGITLTKKDHQKQVETNYNSNYYTFSSELNDIFKKLDRIKPQYEDIADNLELIESEIKRVLS